jgi:hypothetical protein
MSMQVELLKRGYAPGQSVIVGEKKGDFVEVDGVILHTAFCLSNQVSLIETASIEPRSERLYLCGHGNLTERTIGGRKMPELAELLLQAGYRGKQQVYLVACSADEKWNGITMVSILEEELNKRLHRVESDATGTTVTLKNQNGETESWLIQCSTAEKHSLQQMQDQFLRGSYTFQVKSNAQLPGLFQRCKDAMTAYKQRLIQGKGRN